jgi:hypothetical protein
MRAPTGVPLMKVDWGLWGNFISAEIWQVVALSLNIEPDSLSIDWRWANYGDPFDDCSTAFKRRLKIALNHVRNGALPCTSLAYNVPTSTIKLIDFADWALDRKWNLPTQFPRRTDPNSTPKQSVAAPAQRQTETTRTSRDGAHTTIAKADLNAFLEKHGKEIERKLMKAATKEFSDKYIPRQYLRDAIDVLWGRPGRKGRPKVTKIKSL